MSDTLPSIPEVPDGFIRWAIGPALERIEVNMRLWDAWILLSSLQLTICHPDVRGRQLEAQLRAVGKRLEAIIQAMAPADVAAIAAAGWDRSRDVPRRADYGGEWGQLADVAPPAENLATPTASVIHEPTMARVWAVLCEYWGEDQADYWTRLIWDVTDAPIASDTPTP